MSKLTKAYIINSGSLVSTKNNKSITIQYINQSMYNRMLRKIKYQSKWTTYSTGFPLRVNFDKAIK